MRSMFCLLAFKQGRDHLSVNSVVIHLLVNTTVGEDYPPSDGKVSQQIDEQIKHSAAVRLQRAEVCRLPPPSTDLVYREHAVWVRRGESELQLIQTEEKTQNEGEYQWGASQCQGQIKPVCPPKNNLGEKKKKKGTKQKRSQKTHHVPENQLNSLQQLTTLAYLHSCQVAGFGVKQGLFKVLVSMGSLLGDLQLLCHSMACQGTYGIALVWLGTKLSAKHYSHVALEQVELQHV